MVWQNRLAKLNGLHYYFVYRPKLKVFVTENCEMFFVTKSVWYFQLNVTNDWCLDFNFVQYLGNFLWLSWNWGKARECEWLWAFGVRKCERWSRHIWLEPVGLQSAPRDARACTLLASGRHAPENARRTHQIGRHLAKWLLLANGKPGPRPLVTRPTALMLVQEMSAPVEVATLECTAVVYG